MEFEERVRRGLQRAGLDGYGWVELLALNLIPAPSQWRDGSPLWKFSVPSYLIVSIVTGTMRSRRLTFGGPVYSAEVDFGQPGVARVTFVPPRYRGPQQYRIPMDRIRAVEMKFLSPATVPREYDSLYGPPAQR
jgi:hypothetical protein